MILSPQSLSFACNCGKKHDITTTAIIEEGALCRFDEYLSQNAISGKVAAVYDTNTYTATQAKHPAAAQEIILPAENMHADEQAVQLLESKLESDVQIIAAIGSGTLHDVCRYVAAQKGVRLVSVPTAASVDGFASSTSAMTWKGFKTTMAGIAPELIVADTEIIAAAPLHLNASGVGDVLGKYVALADWRIAHLLTGEYYCKAVDELMLSALRAVRSAAPMLKQKSTQAAEKLIEALILAGVAMQACKISRPAAGAEHYVSHMLEMPIYWLNKTQTLHGEKVGVGTVIFAKKYSEWAALDLPQFKKHVEKLPQKPNFDKLPNVPLEELFGSLTPSVIKENADICTKGISTEKLIENWEEIRQILSTVPPAQEITDVLIDLGAPTTLADVGQNEQHFANIIKWSPLIRNRLTFNRVLCYL